MALCFDMYGTVCDTTGVTGSIRAELGIPAGFADAVDELWRRKQLQYANRLSQMGRYEPFREVTDNALEYALAYYDLPTDAEEALSELVDSLVGGDVVHGEQ